MRMITILQLVILAGGALQAAPKQTAGLRTAIELLDRKWLRLDGNA